METSTQSLHEGIAGAGLGLVCPLGEAGVEQHPHDADSTAVWRPSEPKHTTDTPNCAALLKTSSVASIKTVAVIESRGCVFIGCRCVSESESRSYAFRIQHSLTPEDDSQSIGSDWADAHSSVR